MLNCNNCKNRECNRIHAETRGAEIVMRTRHTLTRKLMRSRCPDYIPCGDTGTPIAAIIPDDVRVKLMELRKGVACE